MSAVRIRVVSRNLHPNASREEKERNFKILHATFKRQVNDSGIITLYKEKQYYESKSQKRRRKFKAAELQRKKDKERLKTKLRENFGGQ